MSDFVTAYDGEGHACQIPEHWVGHPVLGKPFTMIAPDKVTPPDCCGNIVDDDDDNVENVPVRKPARRAGVKEKK